MTIESQFLCIGNQDLVSLYISTLVQDGQYNMAVTYAKEMVTGFGESEIPLVFKSFLTLSNTCDSKGR